MRERYLEGLLNPREAARVLGVSPRTLEAWRALGKGPTYFRVSRRVIRYSHATIKRFLEERERMSPDDVETLLNNLHLL
jgi:predicted site-specific integrase-resolvase